MMKSLANLLVIFSLGLVFAAIRAGGQNSPTAAAATMPEPLAWDAMTKEITAKKGATNATVSFSVTNISSAEVVIRSLRPSCGCTIAKMPSQPWCLEPGASGQIAVAIDLRGKFGVLTKYITVDTSVGYKLLILKVSIPEDPTALPTLDTRTRNLMLALADRQGVFKNDCAQCHSAPGAGKQGEALFQAVCAICHESPHRASMVPDLRAKYHPGNRLYWKQWVSSGKVGSLMPAFAQSEGGPLTEAQIESLVDTLLLRYPRELNAKLDPRNTPAGLPRPGSLPVPGSLPIPAGLPIPGSVPPPVLDSGADVPPSAPPPFPPKS